ncbi:hypothetical protein FXF51_51435 [Nonomuraea sp. PA05]|uniref:hypothetical protein n=1 Tax=Nonomuraea sp. PA05 TaxID=2604466 RepID=UPI0011D3E4F3|nr:hypothetical protein [Nonomuraea sp. PA05]TYB52354.1 hypothetical protein FXF51_51435 [Nonomuraea sp. PA05]
MTDFTPRSPSSDDRPTDQPTIQSDDQAANQDAGRTPGRGAAPRPGWLRAPAALGRRWPTWLALAWAAFSLSDVTDGLEYTIVFVVPAAGYLFLAVADRRRITWAVVLAALATVVILRVLGIDPGPPLALTVIALAALGLINGRLRGPHLYALQTPGALAFIAYGLLVVSVPPVAGGFLVAAGLLGHAAWDAYHWRADKIVARSFAEWCGMLDLTLGLGLLVILLTG